LIEATKDCGLPIRTIEELKAEIDDLVGGPPAKPKLTDEVISVVKWVDGTVIDSIFRIED
ncbi:MAG: citrate lyase subunit alpha, partial [Candidatus Marinimicrobia bacterium]|nr:citrate lyase subunit alpha [Candidatus Neomarinimicrobiota bacterium]